MLDKVKKYINDTISELKKMTWPSKPELIGSTIVVVVVSLILAVFIGLVDRGLTLVIRVIFGGGVGG